MIGLDYRIFVEFVGGALISAIATIWILAQYPVYCEEEAQSFAEKCFVAPIFLIIAALPGVYCAYCIYSAYRLAAVVF